MVLWFTYVYILMRCKFFIFFRLFAVKWMQMVVFPSFRLTIKSSESKPKATSPKRLRSGRQDGLRHPDPPLDFSTPCTALSVRDVRCPSEDAETRRRGGPRYVESGRRRCWSFGQLGWPARGKKTSDGRGLGGFLV